MLPHAHAVFRHELMCAAATHKFMPAKCKRGCGIRPSFPLPSSSSSMSVCSMASRTAASPQLTSTTRSAPLDHMCGVLPMPTALGPRANERCPLSQWPLCPCATVHGCIHHYRCRRSTSSCNWSISNHYSDEDTHQGSPDDLPSPTAQTLITYVTV